MAGVPIHGRRALGSRPRADLARERRRAARRESREAAAEDATRAGDEDDAAGGGQCGLAKSECERKCAVGYELRFRPRQQSRYAEDAGELARDDDSASAAEA